MNLMRIDNGSDKIWRGVRGKKTENVNFKLYKCVLGDSFNFFFLN